MGVWDRVDTSGSAGAPHYPRPTAWGPFPLPLGQGGKGGGKWADRRLFGARPSAPTSGTSAPHLGRAGPAVGPPSNREKPRGSQGLSLNPLGALLPASSTWAMPMPRRAAVETAGPPSPRIPGPSGGPAAETSDPTTQGVSPELVPAVAPDQVGPSETALASNSRTRREVSSPSGRLEVTPEALTAT